MGKEKQLRTQTVEKEAIPQDGGYGWIILAGCFVISFIVDGVMYSFGIVLPDIVTHYQVLQSDGNLLTSLYTGFLFCSGPIVAGLSNAFGVRSVTIGGTIVVTACFVGSAFSPDIIGLYFLYGVIGGIATGCVYIGSIIILNHYFKERKGIANGIVMSGSGFGSFGFAYFGTFVLQKFGWQISMIIFGAIILQCAIMGALFKPCPTRLVSKNSGAANVQVTNVNDTEKAPEKAVSDDKNEENLNKSTTSVSMFQSKNNLTNNKPVYITDDLTASQTLNITTFAGSLVSLGNFNQTLNMKTLEEEFVDQPWYERYWEILIKILKDIINVKLLVQNFEFFLITMCNFFCFCALFIPYIYIPKHAAESKLSKSEAATILSVIGIVNIPMRFGFGWLADRKIISALNLNTIAIAIAAISIWIIGSFNTFVAQCICGVIFAMGTAGMNMLPNAYISEVVGRVKFDNAFGIINLFRGIACGLGPYLGGVLADKLNMYHAAFYFSAFCFSLGCLMSLCAGLVIKFKSMCVKKTKANEAELQNLNTSKA